MRQDFRKVVISGVVMAAMYAPFASGSTIILQDDFNDGSLSTNPGIGSGFRSDGQIVVTESASSQQFPGAGTDTRVTKSLDSFDAFGSNITQIRWDFGVAPINLPSSENRARFRVGIDSQQFTPSEHWHPLHSGNTGFAVEIDNREFAYTGGSLGRLLDENNFQLATWTYNAAGGNGPLTVLLETSDTGYNLLLSADITVTSGSLMGVFAAARTHTDWYAAVHSQFVDPVGIDMITVTQGLTQFSTSISPVPEPGTLGLMACLSLALGRNRWSRR